MGAGIAGRYERCRPWWEPHLRLTSEFVRCATRPAKKVAVLGAGRLLDIDLRSLLASCEEVHLFDSDPSVIPHWRAATTSKERRRTIFRIEDVTNSLGEWSKTLASRAATRDPVEILGGLAAPQPEWSKESFDGVVSLNILGQLPLYWRDRFLNRFPSVTNEMRNVLEITMGRLQEAHMEGLTESLAEWTAAVTDTEYYHYTVEESQWVIESALFGRALRMWQEFGDSKGKDAWLWHLAPQFVESPHAGEIHRVEAVVRHLKQSSSPRVAHIYSR
jgi:hypothetical protein